MQLEEEQSLMVQYKTHSGLQCIQLYMIKTFGTECEQSAEVESVQVGAPPTTMGCSI